ncbi:MAG: DEAD/DEAH box helicase [Dehalococcoidia bacterium]
MPLLETLQHLRTSKEHAGNFTAWRMIPARAAEYAPFPAWIDPRLIRVLRERGIDAPYRHQAAAAAAVHEGRNVVVVTPTASGKTLCYNLPVLDAILKEPEARAIYLFPTKALSQDQLNELHGVIDALDTDVKTYTYDGDTSGEIRRSVRSAGHIVITNPDMLHTGILPHHTKWVKLFENLRYVVIDELHQYRGVFGSHLANLIRRLRRICAFYGSDPIFICCSATIANPKDLAEKLLDAPVELIDRNGAPSGDKIVAVYNPPVVNRQLGIRRSSAFSVRSIARELLRGGAQTIVFSPSRTSVEVLLTYLRDAIHRIPGEPEPVRGYRGGYLPLERRAIEHGLRDGSIRGVVATNALELGIDIGGLEAAVLHGYPGSHASTWQQFGRAGRRGSLSFAVLVASSSPLSQFIATHPEFIFDGMPEEGRINADNLIVLSSHLKCAAFELPFRSGERFGARTDELLELLTEEEVLHRSGDRYHWSAESFPAEQVNLRSASIDNFVIIEQGPKPRVIGEVDRPSAPTLIHEEAIYMHGGDQYHVDRLDWEEKKAYVRKVDVDYYTDANLAVDLRVLEVFEEDKAARSTRYHGEVALSYVATIFKKIKLDTHENVGWGKIHLPQEDLHTTAYWFSLPQAVAGNMLGDELQAGLWGIGNLLVNVAPLFLLCDPRDIRSAVQVKSPFTEAPTVFIYESSAGGVGFSGRLYDEHVRLLEAARSITRDCACEAGCPSCVGPSNELSGDPKAASLTLLGRTLAGAGA